ncbi:N-acetylmuramoyl-L-alanine amidase [Sphingomonas jinjuensis]|uniref:N-acetylmuramoyl-L-alanine amidase n=1 Tax=Sphingomonas jinjuensis TaxID=535907 RepID=A0A840FHK4_9SPHN|nr:N-acetylmuramoyl-L-alanine amidase [Sphingomonas jinjuensis]MBB4155167.1 N-acetylmuramoyl-L-alanine amidase [Sphingomonas jinjuensis]
MALRKSRRAGAALALVAMLGTGAAWADTIRRVSVDGDTVTVRFAVPVDAARLQLLGPPRQIALDVAGTEPGTVMAPGGMVSAIRQYRRGTGTRVLLDLSQPATVGPRSFTDGGRALSVQLAPATTAGFAKAKTAGPITVEAFSLASFAKAPRYKVVQDVPPRRARALPKVQGEAGRPLVVIDAGHGGVDPGAINPATGLREKDVTLKIAKAIRDSLLDGGRVRVALTRGDDRFLVLRERYGIARALHADLFISVHCDSVGTPDATGASVYTLSEVASDKEAARLAARENKADVIAGVDLGDAAADVSSILIDLAQRETMNASAGFARLLGREAKPLIPVKPNFHRMASLMVLKAPDMPSILFETGYISNPVDAAFLDSGDGREKIAESVRRAVEIHFARRLAGG